MIGQLYYQMEKASPAYACDLTKDYKIIYGSRIDYEYLKDYGGPTFSALLALEEYIADDRFLRDLVIMMILIVLFPGLRLERSCIVATRHNEPNHDKSGHICGRRTAIHISGHMRDLLSGHVHGAYSSLRVYATLRIFCDYVNALYGFADPKYSVRKKLYNPFGSDLINPFQVRGREIADPRDFRTHCELLVFQRIEIGLIQSRNDLLQFLSQFSRILLEGPYQIIIQTHENNPIKLSGSVFTSDGLRRAIKTAGFGEPESYEIGASDVRDDVHYNEGTTVFNERNTERIESLRGKLKDHYERAVAVAKGRLQLFHDKLQSDLQTQLLGTHINANDLGLCDDLCVSDFPTFPAPPIGGAGPCNRPPVSFKERQIGAETAARDSEFTSSSQSTARRLDRPDQGGSTRYIQKTLPPSRRTAVDSSHHRWVENTNNRKGKVDEKEERNNRGSRDWRSYIAKLYSLGETCRRIRDGIKRIAERRQRVRVAATALQHSVDSFEQALRRTRRAHAAYAVPTREDDQKLGKEDRKARSQSGLGH